MKRVIVILTMLCLVSTVNAAHTNVPCDCGGFLGVCQCRVDTNNPNVSNMCDVGLGNKYEVVPKGRTEIAAIFGALGGSILFGVSSFFARVSMPAPQVMYNYVKTIVRAIFI